MRKAEATRTAQQEAVSAQAVPTTVLAATEDRTVKQARLARLGATPVLPALELASFGEATCCHHLISRPICRLWQALVVSTCAFLPWSIMELVATPCRHSISTTTSKRCIGHHPREAVQPTSSLR